MPILSYQLGQAGLSSTVPSWIYIDTSDTLASVTTAGYLNGVARELLSTLSNHLMAEVTIIPSANAQPQVLLLQVSVSNGVYSLVNPYLLSNPVSGQVVTVPLTSATPGTVRAITGKVTETATVMTSGNIVGVRGEADNVGASGGFIYGVQGKVISTGTLSGSSWTAGVFGQLDISAATVNAGQTAPIWADYGTSSGTITSATGMRMFAGTNTTAATLHSMIYLYGKSSNLFELDLNGSTYISTGGSGALSGTIEKIAITIEGVQYYIPCATIIS